MSKSALRNMSSLGTRLVRLSPCFCIPVRMKLMKDGRRGDSLELVLTSSSAALNKTRVLKCTGYGSKEGNNMDNFAMPLNIDKIFGMLEDLMATN